MKLNANKIELRISEVPIIDHVATADGLRVDPRKVRAINEMPRPTDVAAVQRLLTQYLAKFLPCLSDMTKPLRELTTKEVDFQWDEPQQAAFDALKAAVTNNPVLRYYNLEEEVTLQCDAITVWIRSSFDAEWPAGCICVESTHFSGNTIRTDRERVTRSFVRLSAI